MEHQPRLGQPGQARLSRNQSFLRTRFPIKKMKEGPEKDRLLAMEKAKASVRAIVELPFHQLKNIFKHRKTRYRESEKNHQQLQVLFGLGNLVLASRQAA